MTRRSSPGLGGYVTPILLLPAILVGGGSTLGLEPDGWLSALAILPLTALIVAHLLGVRPVHRGAWPLLALTGGVFLLALLQIYWTSDGLWWNDASRADARAGLTLAGVAVDGTWSLTPDDTRLFLLRWLYPLAILLAVAGAAPHERHRTIALVGMLGVVAALLTLVQQVDDGLLPYRSDTGAGQGWFANPNHHGLFLACSLAAALLALPLAVRSAHRRATGFEWSRPLILAAGTVLVAGMAVLLTGSRAALPLFLIALTLALLARPHQMVRPTWLTIGLVALPVLIALAMLMPRYVAIAFSGPDIANDMRWAALPTIAEGAWQALPWGTGFGSFDRVYLGLEPVDLLGERALNEAHNDWAQWLLEGGIGGIALAVGFALLLWIRGRQRLADHNVADRRALLAGAIIVALIAIHSLIDYPTRTVALGSLGMAALALWLVPAMPPERRPVRRWTLFASLAAGIAAIPLALLLHQPFAQRQSTLHAPTDGRGMAERARAAALDSASGTAQARIALSRAPLEVAAYEALALSEPDLERSNALIDAGLAISRRSGILPSLKFQRLLADARFEEAVEQALTLLRRAEPDASFLQSVRLSALDDGFARGLGAQLDARGHWVTPIFALDEEASDFEVSGAQRLLLSLTPVAGGPPPHLVDPVLGHLLDAGRLDEAASLFARLYPDRTPFDLAPYPSARSRTDTTRFDWRFATVQGVRSNRRGARIEFAGQGRADQPLAWRYLALPAGDYRLSVDMTGSGERDAVVPEILCASGSVLGEVRAAGRRVRVIDFAINDGCPLTLVRLRAIPVDRPYRVALDGWRIQRLPAR